MSQKNENNYRETVERYCHVIGKNTTFTRSRVEKSCCYECANRHICEKNGGCKNMSFNVQNAENDT